jgi:hypothetical protein
MLSGVSEMKSQKLSWAVCLRESAVGFCFGGMNEVGKPNCVLYEKDGHIIAHDVQLPSFVYSFTAKPRTSRARSAEPLLPATVENRTKDCQLNERDQLA